MLKLEFFLFFNLKFHLFQINRVSPHQTSCIKPIYGCSDFSMRGRFNFYHPINSVKPVYCEFLSAILKQKRAIEQRFQPHLSLSSY